jgi:predicted hotdog family 3-hydroxylacyl-ACP dehydratase
MLARRGDRQAREPGEVAGTGSKADGALIAEPPCGVEGLVPHRERMKLVRTLERVGDDWAETAAVVDESWPTYADGGVEPVVLVELIAQSVGVHTGWVRRHIEAMGGRGLLVGVRRATFAPGRVACGTPLLARVEQVRQVENYVVYTGAVRDGDRVLCELELQAFRPDDGRWG